jgi:hypothetical protein
MNIEIYVNNEKLDMENISIKDYKKDTEILKEKLSEIKLDFSSIYVLKGDKNILNISFLNQIAEELNLD